MKKTARSSISIIVILVITLISIFTGCAKSETNHLADTLDTITTTAPANDEIILNEEVEGLSSEEYLHMYWEEVHSRIDDEGDFIADVEVVEAMKTLELSGVYCPVVVNGVLVYTDEYGCLYMTYMENSWRERSVLLTSSAHVQTEEGCEIVERSTDQAITYTEETGLLEFWEFGEVVGSYQLPVNSVYAGKSAFVGYIFRDGSNVYAAGYDQTELAQAVGNGLPNDSVCIAHEVEFVIMADYRLGSDPWSQPLFLMEDGTIQAYVTWKGNGEPDDVSHLTDIVLDGVEGGYR